MDRAEMLIRLKLKLSPKRYVHSIGVEYTAASLAMVHGEDVSRARLAGLLHDCAKFLSKEDLLKKAKKNNLPVSETEKENPDLLHGKVGAFYAEKKYGVTDPGILSAITWHTTGHPDMTLLEKIIFVADYIEPNRKVIFELPEIRKEAFLDLDKAVIHILKNTLDYLDQRHVVIDEMTEKTYQYYIKQK